VNFNEVSERKIFSLLKRAQKMIGGGETAVETPRIENFTSEN
jgi:hypothetical protein